MTVYVSETRLHSGHEKTPTARLMGESFKETSQARRDLHISVAVSYGMLKEARTHPAGYAYRITAAQRQAALDAGAVEMSEEDMVEKCQRAFDEAEA